MRAGSETGGSMSFVDHQMNSVDPKMYFVEFISCLP